MKTIHQTMLAMMRLYGWTPVDQARPPWPPPTRRWRTHPYSIFPFDAPLKRTQQPAVFPRAVLGIPQRGKPPVHPPPRFGEPPNKLPIPRNTPFPPSSCERPLFVCSCTRSQSQLLFWSLSLSLALINRSSIRGGGIFWKISPPILFSRAMLPGGPGFSNGHTPRTRRGRTRGLRDSFRGSLQQQERPSARPCTEFDKAYFHAYSHIGVHEEMIKVSPFLTLFWKLIS